jgi:hypothetical protein
MTGSSFLPDEQGRTGRPPLITSLGLLSFINCGLFILLYGLGALAMLMVQRMPLDEYQALMEAQMSAFVGSEDQRALVEQLAALLHASGLLLMLILLVRTIGMWRGCKSGFHIYAAAQLLGIFAPHLVLPWSMLGFFGPLAAVATTALYGTQLKHLS